MIYIYIYIYVNMYIYINMIHIANSSVGVPLGGKGNRKCCF